MLSAHQLRDVVHAPLFKAGADCWHLFCFHTLHGLPRNSAPSKFCADSQPLGAMNLARMKYMGNARDAQFSSSQDRELVFAVYSVV